MAAPLASAGALVALAACGRGSEGAGDAGAPHGDAGATVVVAPRGKVLEAAENEAPAVASAARGPVRSASGERVDVPGGETIAGSTPGDKGRDPVLEPALLPVKLGPFAIDRLPYPNDPAKPPLVGVSRARASELCQQAGARLCTDLEWERACKGPDNSPYATGAAWDRACSSSSCPSGFGVLGMGSLREWTASEIEPVEHVHARAASVRGARPDAADVDHRCAHRTAVDAAAENDDIGFRCCHGAPNAATIPSPKWEQTFRRAELTPAQAAEMFASVRELEALDRASIAWFEEPGDVNVVLARGDAGAPQQLVLTTSPLVWNPVPGEEVLVVAGKAGKDSFIVAFYRLPDERHRIASSFIMKDEKGPIVLAYSGYVRRRLSWHTCWECRGESGNITYRDDNRVVITQK